MGNTQKEQGFDVGFDREDHAVHTPIQAKDEITKKYLEKEGVGCHNNAKYAAMIESVDQSVSKINQNLKITSSTGKVFYRC